MDDVLGAAQKSASRQYPALSVLCFGWIVQGKFVYTALTLSITFTLDTRTFPVQRIWQFGPMRWKNENIVWNDLTQNWALKPVPARL